MKKEFFVVLIPLFCLLEGGTRALASEPIEPENCDLLLAAIRESGGGIDERTDLRQRTRTTVLGMAQKRLEAEEVKRQNRPGDPRWDFLTERWEKGLGQLVTALGEYPVALLTEEAMNGKSFVQRMNALQLLGLLGQAANFSEDVLFAKFSKSAHRYVNYLRDPDEFPLEDLFPANRELSFPKTHSAWEFPMGAALAEFLEISRTLVKTGSDLDTWIRWQIALATAVLEAPVRPIDYEADHERAQRDHHFALTKNLILSSVLDVLATTPNPASTQALLQVLDQLESAWEDKGLGFAFVAARAIGVRQMQMPDDLVPYVIRAYQKLAPQLKAESDPGMILVLRALWLKAGGQVGFMESQVSRILEEAAGMPFSAPQIAELRRLARATESRAFTPFPITSELETAFVRVLVKMKADLTVVYYPESLGHPADFLGLQTRLEETTQFVESLRYVPTAAAPAFQAATKELLSVPYCGQRIGWASQTFADRILDVYETWAYRR